MQVEGGELQSALQYQVLSTGLQHGHLAMVGGVQHQQWSMLPSEKQVSVARFHFNAYTICVCLNRHTFPNTVHADGVSDHEYTLLTNCDSRIAKCTCYLQFQQGKGKCI